MLGIGVALTVQEKGKNRFGFDFGSGLSLGSWFSYRSGWYAFTAGSITRVWNYGWLVVGLG